MVCLKDAFMITVKYVGFCVYERCKSKIFIRLKGIYICVQQKGLCLKPSKQWLHRFKRNKFMSVAMTNCFYRNFSFFALSRQVQILQKLL